MSKSDVLKELRDDWTQFLAIAEKVEAKDQDTTGAVGDDWSIAECLVHVAAWDEEVIQLVKTFIASGTKKEPQHNLNEIQLENRKNLNTHEMILEYLHEAHTNFMSYVETLPEEIFDTESYPGEWIGLTVPNHYKIHRQDIENFLSE